MTYGYIYKINERAFGAVLLKVLQERGLGSMSKTVLDALFMHFLTLMDG